MHQQAEPAEQQHAAQSSSPAPRLGLLSSGPVELRWPSSSASKAQHRCSPAAPASPSRAPHAQEGNAAAAVSWARVRFRRRRSVRGPSRTPDAAPFPSVPEPSSSSSFFNRLVSFRREPREASRRAAPSLVLSIFPQATLPIVARMLATYPGARTPRITAVR